MVSTQTAGISDSLQSKLILLTNQLIVQSENCQPAFTPAVIYIVDTYYVTLYLLLLNLLSSTDLLSCIM